MSSPNGVGSDAPATSGTPGIQRLLFVSDAAVADVDALPPAVRAMIDLAIEVNVLTPTLPGRLAWLADEVDRFRHYADERLDTVLSHMHAIGADAGGASALGSVVTVIADAVTAFEPDHILIALPVPQHANWQERRLIEHVETRFRLPIVTFAVDPAGHTRTADGPLLLCYDGSEDARHAIEHAGHVLGGRDALVVTVWQPTPHWPPPHPPARPTARSTSSKSIAPPTTSASASRATALASRNRQAFTPSRSPSRPPDRCGRRSSRSPTATTPPPSSWDPADSPVCDRCFWGASQAQSCTAPTDPR